MAFSPDGTGNAPQLQGFRGSGKDDQSPQIEPTPPEVAFRAAPLFG
jgi:hypothetical protein